MKTLMKTNSETTDSVLARVLDNMEFLGLIKWKPDENQKLQSFVTEQKSRQANSKSTAPLWSEKAAQTVGEIAQPTKTKLTLQSGKGLESDTQALAILLPALKARECLDCRGVV
jgi:hypothetical protein